MQKNEILEILEVLDINKQGIDEIRSIIATLPTRTDIIKDFLRGEILRTHFTNESKAIFIKQLNDVEGIPLWLIDEIYRQHVVVTLTSKSIDKEGEDKKD